MEPAATPVDDALRSGCSVTGWRRTRRTSPVRSRRPVAVLAADLAVGTMTLFGG